MADETCRGYEVDGELVVVRGSKPLDEQDQAALTELVRAAKEHVERTNPHGGVIQELLAAVRLATHCIPDGTTPAGVLGERDGAEVKQRLKAAAAAARTCIEVPDLGRALDAAGRVPEFVAQLEDDEPELPERCIDCHASSEQWCSCPDGYQPVRVI